YSLDARTPDEEITRDVLLGRHQTEKPPHTIIAVADATHLERNLGLVLELKRIGRPVILALNMMDLAEQRGLHLDLDILSRELGISVVPTVAIRKSGLRRLLGKLDQVFQKTESPVTTEPQALPTAWANADAEEIRTRFQEVDRILKLATRKNPR